MNNVGKISLTSTQVVNDRLLNLGLTTSGTVGSNTVRIGQRNISLADNGNYYHLCVYVDASATSSTEYLTLSQYRYLLKNSSNTYCLSTYNSVSTTPANYLMLSNRALAINSSGDLIAKNCTVAIGTPDAEDVIFIGNKPLRVVSKNGKWYLVVA